MSHALPLAARTFPEPSTVAATTATPPLILLHGLLACSRQWSVVAAELAIRRPVFALDLRNHGQSPRSAQMDFPALVADLLGWLDARGIGRIDLVGHSMGGKVAMALACRHPERIRRLVIVDIAPRHYRMPSHVAEFRAMHELQLDALGSRAEAEMRLEGRVANQAMRRFLANSLRQDEATGAWRWPFDLFALTTALAALKSSPLAPGDRFLGPSFFVAGGRSPYIRVEDEELIRTHFPAANLLRLPHSGHNPHLESRADFIAAVEAFLLRE
jgi:esterase